MPRGIYPRTKRNDEEKRKGNTEAQARYRQRNPERHTASNRSRTRKDRARWRYGLTDEQFDIIADILDHGPCEVCGGVTNPMHIDHNHVTGAFRGILCRGCNIALGGAKDSIETLIALADYLGKRG